MRVPHSTLRSRRQGFSLIELLAVMAIIGILMTLAVGGIFWSMEARRGSNTEATLRVVDKVLAQHWKAVIDKAGKETVPAGVLAMAGGHARRAQVIWVTLRLKQELPMSYQEALYPHLPANPYIAAGTLPPKKVYQTTFASASGPPEAQNASCLLLSLKQNRGGVSITPDELGPGVGDSNGDGIQELVDSWGKPIVFFRFPTGSAELDAANPAAPGSRAFKFRNPLDPDGLLLSSDWNNATRYGNQEGVYWFEQLCHPVHEGNYTPRAFFMQPTLVSGGKNSALGLNNDMSIANQAQSDDNLYSFKLR